MIMVTQPIAIFFFVCKIRFPILFYSVNFSDAYVSLNTRLENIVGRMEDKFGEDCAIHVPPKQQDNEIEQVSSKRNTEFRSEVGIN